MILYFTGTGNSKFAAEELGRRLGEKPMSLFTYIRNNEPGSFNSDGPYIIVTPTYAWRLPHIVEELIAKSDFVGSKDMYFVLTCGDSIGNAGEHAKRLCESKGLNYKGLFKIVMPENYIAMFNVPEEEEAKEIVRRAVPEIDKAARYISQGKTFERKATIIDSFLSGPVNKIFYALFVKDKQFHVYGQCSSCGACEAGCPVGNISLKGGRPTWNGNCIHCMACICSCPEGAIEYGGKSIRKPRYKCPDINKEN